MTTNEVINKDQNSFLLVTSKMKITLPIEDLVCESFKYIAQLEGEGLGNMFKIQKYQPAKPKLIKIGHVRMR